jgi:hypothetical protein
MMEKVEDLYTVEHMIQLTVEKGGDADNCFSDEEGMGDDND